MSFVIVQSWSHVKLSAALWTAAHQVPLSSTMPWSLVKLMSIESVMLSNHPILCCPLLLLPSIFPSIMVFSSESAIYIRWTSKVLEVNFSINSSNEFSGLVSYTDWFDLAVQVTLKSLLQHHNSKALILYHLVFFMVQLSHLYMTTAKAITLTIQTFVCKTMCLLSNTLSRFIIAFFPKSKCLLISQLQSLSTMIFI